MRAVTRCCDGLTDVDSMRAALETIAGLYDGATTRELDELHRLVLRSTRGAVVAGCPDQCLLSAVVAGSAGLREKVEDASMQCS